MVLLQPCPKPFAFFFTKGQRGIKQKQNEIILYETSFLFFQKCRCKQKIKLLKNKIQTTAKHIWHKK